MPFLFCPIGPSKPKKTSPKNAGTIPSNKSQQVPSQTDLHSTSSLLRVATKEHHAQADDELSIRPGDLVLYEYSYEKWTYVTCLRTSERGFVPDSTLSDLRRNSPRRKKLPRSESANHELNDHLDPNDQQSKDLSSKSGDNIRLRPHHHHHHHHHIQDEPPASSLLQSLQGSSGKQSFPRYPHEMRLLETPAYNNLKTPNSHFEHLEPDIAPFHRQNLGVYLVTHNFIARAENDLSVAPGEYVTLLNRDDKDWFWVRRTHDLVEGFVPARFMCRCEEARSILTKGNSIVTMDLSRDFHTYINHPPDKESLATDQHSSSALVAS